MNPKAPCSFMVCTWTAKLRYGNPVKAHVCTVKLHGAFGSYIVIHLKLTSNDIGNCLGLSLLLTHVADPIKNGVGPDGGLGRIEDGSYLTQASWAWYISLHLRP